jgi:hypothetical protein
VVSLQRMNRAVATPQRFLALPPKRPMEQDLALTSSGRSNHV